MSIGSRTLSQLKDECEKRGIEVSTNEKYTRYDFAKKVADYELARLPNPTWAMKMRNEWESPMLVFSFKHLKPNEQKACLTSPDWIATEKINGCRINIFYHPDEGFSFFSRHRSVKDFLPVDYTDNVLIINPALPDAEKIKDPRDFKHLFKVPFILDGEIKASGMVDTSAYTAKGAQSYTELNSSSALLALNAEASREIQTNQHHLEFFIFDIIYYKDKYVVDQPYHQRSSFLKQLLPILNGKGLPFKLLKEFTISETCTTFNDVFQDFVKDGGEGLVLKNINSPYTLNSTRRRNYQVKLKRTMAGTIGRAADIDAFIIGHTESSEDKGFAALIGGLKFAVYIRKEDGTEYMHHIGSSSGIPLELRKLMTVLDHHGKPKLNPDYYEKVLTINGMGVTPRSKRFSHCTISWEVGFRDDKDPTECKLDEDVLELIM